MYRAQEEFVVREFLDETSNKKDIIENHYSAGGGPRIGILS